MSFPYPSVRFARGIMELYLAPASPELRGSVGESSPPVVLSNGGTFSATTLVVVPAAHRLPQPPCDLVVWLVPGEGALSWFLQDYCDIEVDGTADKLVRQHKSTATGNSPRARGGTSGGAAIVLQGTRQSRCQQAMPDRLETPPGAFPTATRPCAPRHRPEQAYRFLRPWRRALTSAGSAPGRPQAPAP